MPSHARSHAEQAYRSLMNSLDGRATPVACVFQLIGWIHIATGFDHPPRPGQGSLVFDPLTSKVLHGLLRWLTVSRTQAELEAFSLLECCCSAAQRSDAVHSRGERHHSQGDYENYEPWWYFLSLCLRAPEVYISQPDPCPDLTRMDKVRRRQAWPFSIRRLLPHGPQKTVDGVIQWFHLELDARQRVRFIWFLEVLVRFCRPAVTPYILVSKLFLSSVIAEPIQRDEALIVAMHVYDEDNDRRHVDVVDYLSYFSVFMARLLLMSPNETQTWIFHCHADPRLLLEVYGRILNMCQAMNRVLDVAEQLITIVEMTERLGERLIEDRGMPLGWQSHSSNSLRPCFIEYSVNLATEPVIRHNLWTRLIFILDNLELAQQCSAPDCFTFISDRALKLCMGCGFARYCSRRCQKNAWRHRVIPHRPICLGLARICIQMNIPKVNLFEELRYRPEAATPSRQDLEAPALQNIFAHFRTLTVYKMDGLGLLVREEMLPE